MESAGYGAAWLKIAVWLKMDPVVPFGDIAIFERSSSSMKSSAPCQTVWPRQDPIAPASTIALNLGVLLGEVLIIAAWTIHIFRRYWHMSAPRPYTATPSDRTSAVRTLDVGGSS